MSSLANAIESLSRTAVVSGAVSAVRCPSSDEVIVRGELVAVRSAKMGWIDTRRVQLNESALQQIIADANVFELAEMVRALPSNVTLFPGVPQPSTDQVQCPWGRDPISYVCLGPIWLATTPATEARTVRDRVVEVLGTNAAEALSHRLSATEDDKAIQDYDAAMAFVAATDPAASKDERLFQLGQLAAVELNDWLRLW